MKIRDILALFIFYLCTIQNSTAQESYTERAKKYIKQYAAYAIADQRESGVPAAITLGQGILETEAGISELVTEANNHFGIKCKNGWQGPTFLHTDDAKDECFKKYRNALESYNDHSAHLHRNPRYSILFSYSVTDYARWAHGLKKCGYATNPRYAYQLIKIIEEFRLQEYTYAAADSLSDLTGLEAIVDAIPNNNVVSQETKEVPVERQKYTDVSKPISTNVTKQETNSQTAALKDTVIIVHSHSNRGAAGNVDNNTDSIIYTDNETLSMYPPEEPLGIEGAIKTINGLKAITAKKGDALLQYAIKHKIRYAQFLEMNDLSDEPLPFDSYLYLEKKNTIGQNEKHTVKTGETLLMIAQAEGIQLKKLAALNLLNTFEQPVAGTILELKNTATSKPQVEDYKEKPIPVLENTTVASTEEVSFGMSFEAPSENAKKIAIENTYKELKKESEENTPPASVVNPAKNKNNIKIDAPDSLEEEQPKRKSGVQYYTVKKGETAFSIAKRYEVTVAQLEKWNAIKAQKLKAGQKIIVSK